MGCKGTDGFRSRAATRASAEAPRARSGPPPCSTSSSSGPRPAVGADQEQPRLGEVAVRHLQPVQRGLVQDLLVVVLPDLDVDEHGPVGVPAGESSTISVTGPQNLLTQNTGVANTTSAGLPSAIARAIVHSWSSGSGIVPGRGARVDGRERHALRVHGEVLRRLRSVAGGRQRRMLLHRERRLRRLRPEPLRRPR